MNALIYVRVSSGPQEEGTSLETQEAACREYAASKGYTVVGVYREVHTGTELWERPQLTVLRDAVRRRQADAVIIYAIDRLSRDPVHLGVIISEAEHAGVMVEFVTEPLDNSPEGQLIRFVRGYAAKVEHEKIRERAIRERRARILSGRPLPGKRPPYGYLWVDEAKTRLEPDPTTAPIARRMFSALANGATLLGVATQLTKAGIPTATGKAVWDYVSVRDIVTNPVYIGLWVAHRHRMVRSKRGTKTTVRRPVGEGGPRPLAEVASLREWDGSPVILPDIAPALVSPELFATVQARLTETGQAMRSVRRDAKDREELLLRGGIGRCGYCGGALVRHNPSGVNRGKAVRYRCDNRKNPNCRQPTIVAAELDAAVWARVSAFLRSPGVRLEELRRQHEESPAEADLAAVNRRLKDIARQRDNLLARIAGEDDADIAALYREKLGMLVEQHRQLERERAELTASRDAAAAALSSFGRLVAWLLGQAPTDEEDDYDTKREKLLRLGVRVKLYRKDEPERWTITAAVPLELIDAAVDSPPATSMAEVRWVDIKASSG